MTHPLSICLVVSLCVIVAITTSGERDEGLVAYWSFDEGEGNVLQDSSLHAHHGKITGHLSAGCTSG